jgi:hypothetical protein
MLVNNFIAFLTVIGFFIGLVYSIVIDSGPDALVINTILITLGFYTFASFFFSFYIKYLEIKIEKFPKEHYESSLDELIEDVDQREERFASKEAKYNKIVNEQLKRIEQGQGKSNKK